MLRKHKVGKLNKFDWRILVMFLPGIIFVMLFTLYPILKTMIMSFFDWKIGYQQVSTYLGIDNYISVFSDPIAKIALVNTLVYAIVTVPLQMVFGLLVALIIFKLTRFSTTFRLGYYLPVITSWVVVALLFRYLFANKGVINYLIVDVFKISNSPVRWLSSRWSVLSSAMLLGVWKGIGWNMVIFLAALQAVPEQLYEAARIDGANKWQEFFYITLPSIKGTILFALVMLLIGAFNTYTPIEVLTGGNPMHQTEVVLTWMYYKVFNTLNMGYSAALSVVITVIIIILTAVIFRVSKDKEQVK